jgi:uncharacterized protein (TIGR02145 family)
MQLGAWGDQITAANYKTKMLCFKFGSVVGMDLNSTAFSTANIKFNPMTTPSSVTNWATVPVYVSTDYLKNVSDASYHYKANVLAGKGDPCKLVGLTIAQIKAGAIDNRSYRLPTRVDNSDFVGSGGLQEPGSEYYTWTPNGENATNPSVGTILKGTANGAQFPASGYRSVEGEVWDQGRASFFWTSRLYDETSAHHMYIGREYVQTSAYTAFQYGHPVRCVPQS